MRESVLVLMKQKKAKVFVGVKFMIDTCYK